MKSLSIEDNSVKSLQVIFQTYFALVLVNETEPCSKLCAIGMQKVTFICNWTVGTCSLSIRVFPSINLNPVCTYRTEILCNEDILYGEFVYSP